MRTEKPHGERGYSTRHFLGLVEDFCRECTKNSDESLRIKHPPGRGVDRLRRVSMGVSSDHWEGPNLTHHPGGADQTLRRRPTPERPTFQRWTAPGGGQSAMASMENGGRHPLPSNVSYLGPGSSRPQCAFWAESTYSCSPKDVRLFRAALFPTPLNWKELR